MVKQDSNLLAWIAGVLALLLIVSLAFNAFAAPEVVLEEVTESSCAEFIPEAVICPEVIVCPVIEDVVEVEPVVCPVYSEEFVVDYAQDLVVSELFDDAITDNDFAEDLLDWMETEYAFGIEDVDDMVIEYNKNYEVDWTEREDGEATVEATLKVYYEISGEDEEFERVDVSFELDDEDLEEFDSYEFADY